MRTATLYLDESGSRHPDHVTRQPPAHGRDWFAMGGIVVEDDDEAPARAEVAAFRAAWPTCTFGPCA